MKLKPISDETIRADNTKWGQCYLWIHPTCKDVEIQCIRTKICDDTVAIKNGFMDHIFFTNLENGHLFTLDRGQRMLPIVPEFDNEQE